jgi:hypothetical protein
MATFVSCGEGYLRSQLNVGSGAPCSPSRGDISRCAIRPLETFPIMDGEGSDHPTMVSPVTTVRSRWDRDAGLQFAVLRTKRCSPASRTRRTP